MQIVCIASFFSSLFLSFLLPTIRSGRQPGGLLKGFFVFTLQQAVIVSKYSDSPTETVGFKVVEDVVGVDDDANLYDNQGAVPNTSAPGADRFRITLTLTNESTYIKD